MDFFIAALQLVFIELTQMLKSFLWCFTSVKFTLNFVWVRGPDFFKFVFFRCVCQFQPVCKTLVPELPCHPTNIVKASLFGLFYFDPVAVWSHFNPKCAKISIEPGTNILSYEVDHDVSLYIFSLRKIHRITLFNSVYLLPYLHLSLFFPSIELFQLGRNSQLEWIDQVFHLPTLVVFPLGYWPWKFL